MVYRRRGYRKCWKPPPKGQRLKVKLYLKRRIANSTPAEVERLTDREELHSDETFEGSHVPVDHYAAVECSSVSESYNYSHCALQASQESPFDVKIRPCNTGRRKPRVLSLFDGISTGYYILTKCLELDIDAYFSSEIDVNAIRVQLYNFGDKIIPIGDINLLSDERLAALGDVDLILGASPCGDLSRVNFRRKGLDDPSGTGVLFYQFVRILEFFRRKNIQEGKRLYWLFENTANMDTKFKLKISRILGCDPTVRCASAFVPMNRKRLFWHNLPKVDCFMATLSTKMTLQQYLEPFRKALVPKVPTLTTNVAAQRSGKKRIFPVEFNGKPEYLSPTDYERLLGFEKHFTDCGLTHSARITVLGKSWSVHVLASLLYPLCDIYKRSS